MTKGTNQHFIASVGAAGDYKEATYRLGQHEFSTRFAPVALARILDLRGVQASILVTAKARERWYSEIARELLEAGLHPEPVDVPDGRNEEELLTIFDAITRRVHEGEEIVLDVTFALRHLPFVYLAAIAYLVGLRGVRVGGIYYGAYELKGQERTVPILDVTTLFELIEWYHGLQTVRENGDLRKLSTRLRRDVGRLFQRGAHEQDLSRAAKAAEKLADAVAAGLPIETGLRGLELRRAIAALPAATDRNTGIAARVAVRSLDRQLDAWALGEAPREKRLLRLTREELERQIRLAAWYADHGEYPKALAILREWMVSALLLVRGETARWLDHAHRKPVEDLLNALSGRARANLATPAEGALASLWQSIADCRNRFAHVGMTEDEVAISQDTIRNLIERCRTLLSGVPMENVPWHAGKRLLVTPFGLSPGVLFSAVRRVVPDRVLVVTSAKAREQLDEALERAGRRDIERRVIELTDPHQGFLEVQNCLDEDLRRYLVEAREVVVNVTGGTTAIQYGVERLAEEAHRLGTPVRRVALIDRRAPEEQRAEPYVLGELVELNGSKEV